MAQPAELVAPEQRVLGVLSVTKAPPVPPLELVALAKPAPLVPPPMAQWGSRVVQAKRVPPVIPATLVRKGRLPEAPRVELAKLG